ncbi:MAG: alpha/beta hydrolase, partial [Betaproteobacteria bacterium]
IALEAASRAPQRVTRLAMVGTAYPMKVSETLLDTAREAPLKAIDMVNVFSFASPAAKPSFPGPGAWLHGGERALKRRLLAGQRETNLFHHDFSICDRYAGGMEAAARVQCPVTMLLGERDQMTHPKQTRELAQVLKAQVVSVPGAGHSLMAEAPDAVLHALRAALG